MSLAASGVTKKQPIHLLHVFPAFEADGMELIAVRVMEGLGPGFRHTVVSLLGRSGAEAHADQEVSLRLLEPPSGLGSPVYAWKLARMLRETKPDMLLTYNWGAIDAVLAAVLGRICPVVHHEHGFGAEEADSRKSRRLIWRRHLLPRAAATIVVSRNLERIALEEFRLPASKLLMIPNGVDVNHFRPGAKAEARRKLNLPQDATLFCFTGNFRPEKNLSFLIEAMEQAKLAEARLVLVGDGALRGELESLIRQKGMQDAVIFTGRLRDPQVALSASDVFVLTSSTEQMPMSLLEAMSCGLAAIVTDVGDCRILLGNEDAKYAVPSGDLGSYVAAMRSLAGNPEMRAEVGTRLRRRAVTEYSLQKMVQRYERAYREAMGGRSGA